MKTVNIISAISKQQTLGFMSATLWSTIANNDRTPLEYTQGPGDLYS